MSYCPNCGKPVADGQNFCAHCGLPQGATAPAMQGAAQSGLVRAQLPQSIDLTALQTLDWNRLRQLAGRVLAEPTGLVQCVCVYFLTKLVSETFWSWFAVPGTVLGSLVTPGNCGGFSPKTWDMYLCSAKVALQVLAGPLIIALMLAIFAKPIRDGVRRLQRAVPLEVSFLVSPLVVTALFSLSWAAMHSQTGNASGVVQQVSFPATVGRLAFLAARYAGIIHNNFRSFFTYRDRFSTWLRAIAVFVIPAAFSLLATNQERVTNTAQKEQATVIVALVSSFILLSSVSKDQHERAQD